MTKNQGDEEGEDFKPPDGGYGWVIILANFIINLCLLTLVQSFGLIFNNEFKEMGITKAKTSFLLHLNSSIYCSLGLVSGPLLRRFNYRQVAFLGSGLMAFGIFLSNFGHSYTYLILTISVIMGTGQGIVMPATYIAINTYFKKRLTLAVSLNITAASVSSVFMPQICHVLLNHFGTRGTVVFLTVMSLGSFVGCALLKPLRKKSKREVLTQETLIKNSDVEMATEEKFNEMHKLTNGCTTPYQDTVIPIKPKTIFQKISDTFNLELLRNRSLLIILICLALSFAAELNIILTLQFMLPELAKFERQDVATALSVLSISDIVGRLLVPMVAHIKDVGPKIMYSLALLLAVFGRSALATHYDLRYFVFVSVAFIGVGKGIKAVYQSVILPKYVNLDRLPGALGLNMVLTGITSLIIGFILGEISDKGGSYIYALIGASCISVFCVFIWVAEYFIYRNKRKVSTTV